MRPTIKKILYASDINQGSRPAFRQSVSLAHEYGAEIVYIHVMDDLPESAARMVSSYISKEELLQHENEGLAALDKTVRERIHTFFDEEMQDLKSEVTVSFCITHGDVAKAILKTADDIDADMIVMGARKHSVVERMLIGSVSNKVLHSSTKPVLIVPLTDED